MVKTDDFWDSCLLFPPMTPWHHTCSCPLINVAFPPLFPNCTYMKIVVDLWATTLPLYTIPTPYMYSLGTVILWWYPWDFSEKKTKGRCILDDILTGWCWWWHRWFIFCTHLLAMFYFPLFADWCIVIIYQFKNTSQYLVEFNQLRMKTFCLDSFISFYCVNFQGFVMPMYHIL